MVVNPSHLPSESPEQVEPRNQLDELCLTSATKNIAFQSNEGSFVWRARELVK